MERVNGDWLVATNQAYYYVEERLYRRYITNETHFRQVREYSS